MWYYFALDQPATAFLLICSAPGASTNAVDLYNSATGAWSTAQLSFPRNSLAATSAGNFSIFAGGGDARSLLSSGIRYLIVAVVEHLIFYILHHRVSFYLASPHANLCRRINWIGSNAVDLYNGVSGLWTTAQLSLARWSLAATSAGNVAIFAGGFSSDSALLWIIGI